VPDGEITAALRAIRSELEVSGATYADESRLLAAVEAVRTIARGWSADAPEVPMIARDLAADVITRVVTRELLGKETDDA
jgi:hypothetical protein